MENSRLLKKFLFILFLSFIPFLSLFTKSVLASGATIAASPSTGSYGTPFTVSLNINGGGQAFNAAQATVQLSPNLSLQNLILGNCNFSFLTTPSIANPSFAGILLGSSLKACTVYAMTIAPIQKGTGTISLFKGSVRRFGDAVNILTGMTGGAYTLTAVTPKSSLLTFPAIASSKGNLYSLLLAIQTGDMKPVTKTVITLKLATTKTLLQGKTDAKGYAQFTNLQPGIYDATVSNYTGDHILNVVGRNHALILGITLTNPANPLLSFFQNHIFLSIGILLILGIVLGVGVTNLVRKRKK